VNNYSNFMIVDTTSHFLDLWLKNVLKFMLINAQVNLVFWLVVFRVEDVLVQFVVFDGIFIPNKEVAVVHLEVLVWSFFCLKDLYLTYVDYGVIVILILLLWFQLRLENDVIDDTPLIKIYSLLLVMLLLMVITFFVVGFFLVNFCIFETGLLFDG